MDIRAISPALNLFNRQWPLRTAGYSDPPSKFAFDDEDRRGHAIESVLAGGCIISGALIRNSVIGRHVYVHAGAEVADSIVFDYCDIGRRARLRRCILEKNVKIQEYHAGLFAQFLGKLRSTPDGDGSLLDHSVILYGSNMSNSNAHDHFPLPNLVVGRASGRLEGGRHLKYPDHTPMSNLLVTLLDKSGVRTDTLGDSTVSLVSL